MPYAILDENTVVHYPATLQHLQALHPDVSFPAAWETIDLSAYGVTPVAAMEPPEYDAKTHRLREATPELVRGKWRQRWITEPLPESDLLQRCTFRSFWDALVVSRSYAEVREQAKTDLAVNIAYTEFVAALADAKSGHPNARLLQNCFNNLVELVDFTDDELAELQILLDTNNMSPLFSL